MNDEDAAHDERRQESADGKMARKPPFPFFFLSVCRNLSCAGQAISACRESGSLRLYLPVRCLDREDTDVRRDPSGRDEQCQHRRLATVHCSCCLARRNPRTGLEPATAAV